MSEPHHPRADLQETMTFLGAMAGGIEQAISESAQSLFKFGHHQKDFLSNTMFGFFSGALQNIMGQDSTLEISHASENA